MKRGFSYEDFRSLLVPNGACLEWVKSCTTGGYGQTQYKGKRIYVHRLTMLLEGIDIPKDKFVLHTCDNPCCCNPDHLFLGTHQDNMDDKVRKGRQSHAKGIDAGMAKLSNDDVIEIRNIYSKGGYTQEAIGNIYDITQANVSFIVNRKNWSHI